MTVAMSDAATGRRRVGWLASALIGAVALAACGDAKSRTWAASPARAMPR